MVCGEENMLSAVVVTQNEERNIERCLRSVRFADEIIVVDALSDDRTPELARSLGAKVVSRKWDGFASQKQFAIDQAAGDWVLLIDSDEEVTPELEAEIRSVVTQDGASTSGYRIPRRNFFLGKRIEHGPWSRDEQLRLFKKEEGSIARRPVHEGVQLAKGIEQTLENPLNHFTHQTLVDTVKRMNRYTSLEAEERAGRRRVGLLDAFFAPAGVFLNYYVAKGGWRDGVYGFLLAATTAMYRSVLYIKIYLAQRGVGSEPAV